MSEVKVIKLCYTSPSNNRLVSVGIYNTSDFSKDEMSFLVKHKAVKEITQPISKTPNQPEEQEIKTPTTRKKRIQKPKQNQGV